MAKKAKFEKPKDQPSSSEDKPTGGSDIVDAALEGKPVRINVSVPAALHRAFKVKAVERGESHQDILLAAIKRYVEE